MLSLVTTVRADYTTGLLSQWTFNSGTSADLTSDIGGFTFAETGAGGGQTTTFNGDGTITLGQGRELVASGINSTAFPGLTGNVTLWARMQWGDPSLLAFFMGLENALAPSDDYAVGTLMAMFDNSVGNVRGYANLSDATAQSSPSIAAPANEFFTIALVFDDENPAAGTDVLRLNVNGIEAANSFANVNVLNAFQAFAVGRLRPSGHLSGSLSVDELRIYDSALTAGQISQIEVVPVPEPSAFALMACGGILMMAQTWRSRRKA